jgi:hypothetical protein
VQRLLAERHDRSPARRGRLCDTRRSLRERELRLPLALQQRRARTLCDANRALFFWRVSSALRVPVDLRCRAH